AKLSQFTRIKWERARELRKSGAFEEAENELKEALAQFRIARRLSPNDLFLMKQEGFCLYRLKDYKHALEVLGDAFRRDPGDFIVKSTLSKIYTTTDDLEGYADLLEKVLSEHPHQVKLMGVLKGVQKALHAKKPAGP
ncbi:MAG: hypothetical protein GY849_21655, partial [Deltaproteobacteria bacterium]|nr:hypothetical protein [Deltaproteobacteria bacterium]